MAEARPPPPALEVLTLASESRVDRSLTTNCIYIDFLPSKCFLSFFHAPGNNARTSSAKQCYLLISSICQHHACWVRVNLGRSARARNWKDAIQSRLDMTVAAGRTVLWEPRDCVHAAVRKERSQQKR